MSQVGEKACFEKRLLAFLIDFILLCLVHLVVYGIILLSISDYSGAALMVVISVSTTITFFVYLIKEYPKGMSPGKRLMHLGVRDEMDGTGIPGKLRLFLRNLLILFGPVEFILLVCGRRRIGDWLTKTNVFVLESQIQKTGVIFNGDAKDNAPR